MTITADLWQRVRERAQSACEYCGVTETDSAGALTVDHYHPTTRGGTDDFENLLYCCYRCNLYKAGYSPDPGSVSLLWNPRRESIQIHLLLLDDGTLYPVTPEGVFTLARLRLNRPPLVSYRLKKSQALAEQRLLTRYESLIALLERLGREQAELLAEQRSLLQEQRSLLRVWLESQE
jgi:hypothetical protein